MSKSLIHWIHWIHWINYPVSLYKLQREQLRKAWFPRI